MADFARNPPPPCPQCGNPRTAADVDRLCEKCRSDGKLKYAGSLLELRVTLESNPAGLDALPHWRTIRHYGRELWGSSFDARPMQFLLDWLVAEHSKGLAAPAEFVQLNEVVELLRVKPREAETEKSQLQKTVAPTGATEPEKATGPAEPVAATAPQQPDDGPWSEADGPKQWARKFGFSVDTLIRRFKDGTIRHKKFSSKSYAIHEADLPKPSTSASSSRQ